MEHLGAGRVPPNPTLVDGKTVRVRGVPQTWSADQFRSFIREREDLKNPVVESFAPEIYGRSSTATVTFREAPADLRTLRPGQPSRLPLPTLRDDARPQYLALDVDFLGMTTLFKPPEKNHKVDIVAIPGLGGHAFGSFKERGGDHMWLRDALPDDLTCENDDAPMARIMTYGYESAVVGSMNIQNLEDLATSLHGGLLPLTRGPRSRPIVFLAHSLGGLVLKQVLISLARSTKEEDKKLRQAVYGIAFFGVPHDGMDTNSLIPMVGDGPNRFLVESISRFNSQILTMQQREFHQALGVEGEAEVFCFYETMLSPTAQQDEYGKWAMNGPPALLVTKSSATHCRRWEDGAEHICAINRTHSNIVKFGLHDNEYENARERLLRLARRAATTSQSRARALGTHFIVPYFENPDFIGQADILAALQRQLGFGRGPGASKPRPRVSLHGLGGTGKTQIALAYVFWLRDTCPDVSVFWVHAGSTDRFRESFFKIAQDCQVPGHDDPKIDIMPLVKGWLETKVTNCWLMVIDNADDAEIFYGHPDGISGGNSGNLARYLPECSHGSLLITTRNKQAGVKMTKGELPIEVGHMQESDCKILLRARLEGVAATDSELSTLSDRLAYLPLALVQAAAFVQENSLAFQDYLQLQDESDQSLVDLLSQEFETVGRDSETPRAVVQTWMISFQQIRRQNMLAAHLLSLMSLLDRQGIPNQFLSCYSDQERNGGPRSKVELEKALGVLKAFCLVAEGTSGSLNIHRLVQLVTRKWLVKEDSMGVFIREALLTVSQMYPPGRFEDRATCSAYLPHAYAVIKLETTSSEGWETKAELLDNMARYLNFEGKLRGAEDLEGQAIQLKGKVLGDEHPDTLSSMGCLTLIYCKQGRWKEAEKLEVQVLETRKRVLGEDHPDTLVSMSNLASAYRNQGHWKEAQTLEVQVLETRKRVLGEDHPATLVSMSNIASTYGNQGHWKEAEKLGVQVLETRKRVLGEDHPSTLTSIGNLASAYRNQGHWEEAEKLEVQVLETSKRVLGEDHPDTLTSTNNLAYLWNAMGRHEDALCLMQRCIHSCQRVLGNDHPNTKACLKTFARWQRHSLTQEI